MEANVKYNDFKGTAAADHNDKKVTDFKIDQSLESCGVDLERYKTVGFRIKTGVAKSFSLSVILLDKSKTDEEYLVELYLNDNKIDNLFDIFKNFEVLLFEADKEYSKLKIKEDYVGSMNNPI